MMLVKYCDYVQCEIFDLLSEVLVFIVFILYKRPIHTCSQYTCNTANANEPADGLANPISDIETARTPAAAEDCEKINPFTHMCR